MSLNLRKLLASIRCRHELVKDVPCFDSARRQVPVVIGKCFDYFIVSAVTYLGEIMLLTIVIRIGVEEMSENIRIDVCLGRPCLPQLLS